MNPITIMPLNPNASGCCYSCRHGLLGKSWTISMGPSGGFHLCASCLETLRQVLAIQTEPKSEQP